MGFYWFFYRVLLGFTGFSLVFHGFTGFYWVLLGFAGFYWVLLGFIWFYPILLDLTVFFSGLDRVFLSFNEIYQTSCLQWDGFFRETFTVQWIIHWLGKPTAGETIKSTVEFNETSLNWRRNESIIHEPKKNKVGDPSQWKFKKKTSQGSESASTFCFPTPSAARDWLPTSRRPISGRAVRGWGQRKMDPCKGMNAGQCGENESGWRQHDTKNI